MGRRDLIRGYGALALALGAAVALPSAAFAAARAESPGSSATARSERSPSGSLPQGSPGRRRIATAHANGEFPSLTLSGILASPARASVSVAAVPAQSVTVSWVLICPGSPPKRGAFYGAAPLRHVLPVPGKVTGPCSVGLRVAPTGAGALAATLED